MIPFADIFGNNIVMVFLLYGLGWFSMAMAIIFSIQRSLGLSLTRSLLWLAFFGFVHGCVEWMDMLRLMPVDLAPLTRHPAYGSVKVTMLALSAFLLLVFGVSLVGGMSARAKGLRWLLVALPILWLASPLYSPLLKVPTESPSKPLVSTPEAADVPALASSFHPSAPYSCTFCHRSGAQGSTSAEVQDDIDTIGILEVAARYVLYLPGLLLAAAGFYLQGREFRRLESRTVANACFAMAGVFGFAAIPAGLVVAPVPYFPAAWLNYHTFVSAIGIPPQVFRALSAVASALLITRIVRIYRLEHERQLDIARDAQMRAQEQLANQLGTQLAVLTRELTELHTFGERVASENDFEKTLCGLTEITCRLMQADCCAVFVLREKLDLELASFSGACAKSPGRKSLATDCARRVMRCRHTLIVNHEKSQNGNIDCGESAVSIIAAPLSSRDELLGVVTVSAAEPRQFGDPDRMVLETIAGQAAVAIHNARLYAQVSAQSISDGLTGLYNHRYFQERLADEMLRAAKSDTMLSLLFCDLDNFKIFNDTNGHPLGDRALEAVARMIKRSKRAIDVAGRYGGEEFVVILPCTDTASALVVAERIRREVAGHAFETRSKAPSQLTISIGIATFPTDARSKIELVDKADWAMYEAKRGGRNRVSAFSFDKDSVRSAEVEKRSHDDLYLSTVHALAAAVDARDHYTRRHSEFVAFYASAIARELGLSPDEVTDIRVSALLHDVGKIGIGDDILNKPGPLTPEEWAVVRQHTQLGEDILKHVQELVRLIGHVRHHHERFDGKGYPDGLAGDDIPLGARIVAVADSFHAMTSDRPYRPALSLETAISELRNNAGLQFDPQVVNALTSVLESEPEKVSI